MHAFVFALLMGLNNKTLAFAFLLNCFCIQLTFKIII